LIVETPDGQPWAARPVTCAIEFSQKMQISAFSHLQPSHAEQIVRLSAEDEWQKWGDYCENKKLTVKDLRQERANTLLSIFFIFCFLGFWERVLRALVTLLSTAAPISRTDVNSVSVMTARAIAGYSPIKIVETPDGLPGIHSPTAAQLSG